MKNEYKPGRTENLKWFLEIPKINLKAEISDGTTPEILNEYIGHFIETPKENGNIVLAAHNRGYKVNYFERLKELEIGDEIIYTYNGKVLKYIVDLKTIIKDTQIEVLGNTKDNILTLITCVENEPEYRRCIKASLEK
ncbi:MAG: class D sortase [Clostridia bacterium]|nr:class D sortase [Clostridia bacterium]